MSSGATSKTVWVVDPISYSGMAYSDVGQIVALRQLGAWPALVGSDSWMLEPEIVHRIAVFCGTSGSQSRIRRGVRYVGALARLVQLARTDRPAVIHWQFTELPIADVLAMLAIRFLSIPQAYTAHELLPWTSRAYHRWLFSLLYALVDAIIVHNGDQRAEMIRRFRVAPSKIHVAPLGDFRLFATPELPQAHARARIGIPEDRPVALFFGSIRPSKGLEVLLEAWAVVAEKMPAAMLLVVGKPLKGLDTKKTFSLIERLGIGNSVRTRFEQVSPAESNIYYRAADVVVLPYHEIGTSGVLRYAYNSARPVIATSVGEHPRVVVPGETGHLVSPGDPTTLASVLLDTLGDRSALRSMGEAARAYATANFDWLDSARTLLRVYEDLGRRV